MLSYLNSPRDGEEDFVEDGRNEDYELIEYLETAEIPPRLPLPFSWFFPHDLPRGRDFLRFCKFGTLQVLVLQLSYRVRTIFFLHAHSELRL